jgi:hypothetical protein
LVSLRVVAITDQATQAVAPFSSGSS